MKKFYLFLSVFAASFTVFSQTQINLTFLGKVSQTQNALSLDSISIKNLTEDCDTTLLNVTINDSVSLIIPDVTWPLGINEIIAGGSGALSIKQNYPNPFYGSTNLNIYRENNGPMSLVLFDGLGRQLASYQNKFDKGTHSFIISSACPGVMVLSVSDGKIKKSIRIISTRQGQGYNDIKYIGQLPNIERRILKNSASSGFSFYLGNDMIFTAHANGYADQTIVDTPTSDSTYTFNMTLLSLPAVETFTITDISQNTATGGGNVTSDGGETVTARGICWNTTGSPTTDDNVTIDGTGTGYYNSILSGLTANTPYFVRAYATNNSGTAYGDEVTFTSSMPLLDTEAAINDTLLLCYSKCYSYIEQSFLFDAVYSNNILAPDSSWTQIYNHTQSSDNEKILMLWSDAYDIIYKTNLVIQSSEAVISDPATKNIIIAQAKAIRAYLNYNLLNWFGEIPLEAGTFESVIPRNTIEEVLIQINQDATDASLSLPMTWSVSDKFRIPKSFAIALLSRASLYNKNYNEALSSTQQIINSGVYAIGADPSNFSEGNIEIFWGFNKSNNTEFNNFFDKGSYVPVIRYTESYLISAEALFETGNTTNALNYINALNARRGNPSLTSLTNDELFQQWNTELMKEGSMFITLKRFDKALIIVQNMPHLLLLPVPLHFIISNVNLTQNPGY